MNLAYTKRRILQSALIFVTRNGIRAFRVEEMSRALRISKRTVYRLFPTRTDLVKSCIEDMNETTRKLIFSCLDNREENCLLQLFRFMGRYVEGIYASEQIFWEELRQWAEIQDSYRAIRLVWQEETEKILENCRNLGYVRPEIDIHFVCERLLTDLFEARLAGESYDNQLLFCYIFLRGIVTDFGRLGLEEKGIVDFCRVNSSCDGS